ncbi:hypothetical protein F5J12DRAFT_781967 [Pisolithus orientalis]|uniref:uncharacterized protein n=1 Tax=Pisolithus orientalis TaxID=936130 RepID=UPI0022259711|nr:uncharacterized protein F5J12DRAFT_781967 [Pisolithus orientalis]KAI6009424.1 hypothetical protein F5J12DRAFT_781967 [Pisolithus orientalis]
MPSIMVHLITALTPGLEAALKEDMNCCLRNLIAANIKTCYACSSSQLPDFFLAINDKDLQNDKSVLLDFHQLVPPTDYKSYCPYMIMFNSCPCKLSKVEDMLAPGLPLYISLSSTTSGKQCKQFAKYFMIPPSPNFLPFPVGVTSVVFMFAYRDPVEVVTDSGEVVARIPICNRSTGIACTQNNWTIKTDGSCMASIIPGHTALWATGFIIHHWSFLLIHALFSLFSWTWATLISSIQNGTIPDLEQIDHVQPYLQQYICHGTTPGRTLNFKDTKTFVATMDELIEFLDVTQEPTQGQVLQVWDLQPGKFYQPVLMTHDGLWRYPIDDVIQVTGFNLHNRLPVFRYSRQKKNGSCPNVKSMRQKAFTALVATNDKHQIAFNTNEFGLPTIQIVKPGTLTDYWWW